MKRKIISLLLCLVMALSLIPTVAFGAVGDNHADSLAWNYANITANGEGGFNTTSASIPSGATITVRVGDDDLDQYTDRYIMTEVTADNKTPVTISVSGNFYVARVLLCCNHNNGYSCQTSQTEQAFSKEGSIDGKSITMTLGEIWSHSTHKSGLNDPYWLMVMVAPCPNPVYVGYESGSINGDPISANPVTKDEGTWVTDKFIKQYTTAGTAAPTHNALAISSEAEAEANQKGYTFAGWQLTYYKAYTDGSFSGQTDAGVGGIKSAGASITLFTHAKLVAQWKEAPQSTTGTLTITKELSVTADKDMTFTFNVMQDNKVVEKDVSVTITAGEGNGTAVVQNLTVGDYTVEEKTPTRAPDGYTLSGTTYDYGDGATYATVPANGRATVTVTNTYNKITETVNNTATLTITKVDAEATTQKLTDAVFTLTKDGTTLTSQDNNDGTYTISGINAEGIWTLTETTAPEGYQLPSTIWTITVTEESSEKLTDGKFVTTNTYKISGVDNTALDDAVSAYAMVITNTKIPNTVVKIHVTKTVTISKGSKEPAAIPFTFEAYVDDQKVGSLTLTPTKNGGWTATDDLEVSIPYNRFEDRVATVTIKEVKGTDTRWKYDTKEYTVLVNQDGTYEVKQPENPEIAPLATDSVAQESTALTFTNEYSYKYTPTPRPTTPKPVTSVKTGDMGIALYAVTSLLSLSGAAVIIKKRKDEE